MANNKNGNKTGNQNGNGGSNAPGKLQGDAAVKSDEELNAIIKENKKRAGKGNIIMGVGIVFLLLVSFTLNPILIAAAIIIFGIGLYFRSSAKSAIKESMRETALLPAFREVFENVRYEPEGHITDGRIRSADMGFDFRIDKVEGSDYIRAQYRDVAVEMSDIRLITVTETIDDDGVNRTEDVNFKGLWLICDFHKRFTSDLLLRERRGAGDKLLKRGIKTENDSFNKQFYIQSESEHDVFYILTPHMMEYIQAMDRRAGGRTYMRFRRDGKLILALDTGRDAFEVNKVRKASAESLRKQYIEEIRYVTDLIDELKLVRTLHEKS